MDKNRDNSLEEAAAAEAAEAGSGAGAGGDAAAQARAADEAGARAGAADEAEVVEAAEAGDAGASAAGDGGGAPDAGAAGDDGATPDDADAEGDGSPADLADALAQLAEAQDRYLRLQAEWANFRRRTDADRAAERQRAAEHLVERLLPVVDDLERALGHAEGSSAEALAEGVQAVLAKLCDVLAFEGLTPIDPAGEPFDLSLHQAVGKAEDASLFDETVIEVYQKGYMMAGRVLRPAMVVVSSGGPVREPEPAEPDGPDGTEEEADG